MIKVVLNSGKAFACEQGISLLAAAELSGLRFPYSCRTGRCSTCKCKVLQGESLAMQEEIGLSAAEKAEGWVLSCVRTATSDLVVDIENLGGVVLPESKTVPCRINSIEKMAPDVLRVFLRLPPSVDFAFIPGQYINLIGPNGLRRSYSIANGKSVGQQIELHIRCVNGGALSQYWFEQAKPNDLLRLNGPLGTFFLRDVAELDLVFMATGTGIAPVKAILESMKEFPAEKQPRTLSVLWGGRTKQDLYLSFSELQTVSRFVPVLSRADDQWVGAKGYVQEALLNIIPRLENAAVYACGSNAMIRSAQAALADVGLPSQRFYSDAFVSSGFN
jgi:CDP-4-dehydro-6-deoxyglucose reductase